MSNFRDFVALAGAYIEVVSPAELDVSGPWTAGAWVRPNSLTGTQVILRVGTADNGPTRGFMWTYSSTQVRVRTVSNWANGAWTPSAGTWYRLGITKAGSGIGQIRNIVNGADVGGANLSPPPDIIAGDPFRVGGTAVGGLGLALLNAGVAWMFWLQGVTLSAAALDAYLNDPQALVDDYGPSGTVTPGALKVLWPMQCDTAAEEDESGVNNDGVRTGTVARVTTGGPAPTTDWDPCVPPGPVITTQPAAQTVILSNGSAASFTVVSPDADSYQWQRDTGSGFANIDGATAATLALTGLTLADHGDQVRCRTANVNGTTDSNAATLSVYRGPQVETAFAASDAGGDSAGAVQTDFPNANAPRSFIRIVDASGVRTSRFGNTP